MKRRDKDNIKHILAGTNNFNEEEINVAMELVEIYLNNEDQKDYEIFVDAGNDNNNGKDKEEIRGYVCIGPRPLTTGTYDLYWIAVNPKVQSKGVGSGLIKFIEDHLKEKRGRLILIETSGKDSYAKERKFYEKNLYKELVNIRDFYNAGDALVIYGKYIA